MSRAKLIPNWEGIKKMLLYMLSSVLSPLRVLTGSHLRECSQVSHFAKDAAHHEHAGRFRRAMENQSGLGN